MKSISLEEKILHVVIIVIFALLAYSYPAESFLIFLYLVAFFLGNAFGKWSFKKYGNGKLIKFIAWINLISWSIPALGIFTGSTSIAIQRKNKKNSYLILGLIGLIVGLFNGVLGVLMFTT